MGKPHIRIIDDDEDICREIAAALAGNGYDVSWSGSLAAGCGTLNSAVDVLVLDLGLPKTDGFQIIEALGMADRPPDLIVASGYDGRIIRAAVRSAEAAGLHVLGSLGKPFTMDALLGLVRARQERAEPSAWDQAAMARAAAACGALVGNVRTAFQSKRRLADAAVIGYEALLRLSMHGQAINPEIVFSPAVDLHTQFAATGVVMNDAMHFASVLRAAGRALPVSVNCTPGLLCEPGLQQMVSDVLDAWKLPATALQIEITEHETATSFDRLAAAASRLAMRDCKISVDDFGRGATSFERLTDLPLNELKIDKTVFWQSVAGQIPVTMLEEVIRYCADHGILSVVEGIETAEHWQRAIAAGADAGQGFLWDRPAFDPVLGGSAS